jgi:hypothetical protein
LESFPVVDALYLYGQMRKETLPQPQGIRHQFDSVFKALLNDPHSALRAKLTGGVQVLEVLEASKITFKTRVADLVWRLADGSILHIEIQSRNDPNMACRMAGYALALREDHKCKIVQIVLYVGGQLKNMPDTEIVGNHTFRCDIIDMREFSSGELLASGSTSDALLSLLAADGVQVIREVVQRIARLSPEERQIALAIVNNIMPLRAAMSDTLKKEFAAMPLYIEDFAEDFEKIKDLHFSLPWNALLLEQARKESKAEGRSEMLLQLLQAKFGPLPDGINERVAQATQPEIDSWAVNVLTATTLEQVFAASITTA